MNGGHLPLWKKILVDLTTLAAYAKHPLRDALWAVAFRRLVASFGKRHGWSFLYQREGVWFYAGEDWWEWFILPEIECADWRFMRDNLRYGDLFIDGGSHIGCYTLMAAARGAHVFAVDAAKRPLRILQKVLAWNSGGIEARVQTFRGVLSSKDGETVPFYEPSGNNCGHVSERGTPTDTVTLDRLAFDLCDFDPERIFLKLDLEGYETEALKGAKKLLLDRRLRWIVLEHNSEFDRIREQAGILTEAGFCEYTYNPETRRLVMGHNDKLKHKYWAESNNLWGRPIDAVCAECGAGCEY